MNFFSAGPGPVRPSIHPGAAQQRRLQQLHRSAQVIVDQVFIVIIITLYLHLKSIYYYYICNCSLIETSLWPSLSVRRSIGRSVIILHWVSSLPTLLSENLLLNEQGQLVGFKFTGKLMISRWFTTNYVWNTRNMAEILLLNTVFAVSNSLYWVYSEMWEWKEKEVEDGREGGWKTLLVLV